MELSKLSSFIMVACSIAFPLLVIFSLNNQDQMYNIIGLAKVKVLGENSENITENNLETNPVDVLLGGLLASGFDRESCESRYRSSQYRKYSLGNPSEYLISKLRKYEKLHKKCEPLSELYNKSVQLLSSPTISTPSECNYVIWEPEQGLGNRILSKTSAFLYALLTDRVLLLDHYGDMEDLFCEPFPDTTWILPRDFPEELKGNKPRPSFGNLIKGSRINASMEFPPSYIYFEIFSGMDFFDMLFHCEEYHRDLIRKVPWLAFKSDEYFVPSLFLMPYFQEELGRMFTDKETVFHHLGRYLFHPANKPWGLVTRFYDAYLARAERRVGIQVRVFNPEMDSIFPRLMDQITTCTLDQNLLPNLNMEKLVATPKKNKTLTSVMVASLYSDFYDKLTNMYSTFPTTSGDVVAVYQPSHEGHQLFGENDHNIKAWVEMNLLSFSDVLVTSACSTFGYVAMGLGGLKSWMLARPEGWNMSIPACKRMVSMEPCLHIPPYYDCKMKGTVDTGNVVPFVKHCEDWPGGLKLFNDHDSSL